MKGKFIHLTEIYEHSNCLNEEFKELKTEQKVEWNDPGKELWNIMQKEMYGVYGDVDHIDIALITNMCIDNKIDGIESWAGFYYSDYNSVEDDYDVYYHWYLFVK